MQVFAESRKAYLCIMQDSVSNFADFQFWPYCPSLNCFYFCSSPPLPMKGTSNLALESSFSFNIKSMQKKKKKKKKKKENCLEPFQNGGI